mmetsp:Transcript_40343/g.84407  ORF Transcript_40343/g.84407 Transcript_40343/m.84407 type:complete len:505 (-) Transcript_40343:57-1571(-)
MLRRLSFWGKDDKDKELRQLTRTVRKTMQTQKREVKGISDIVFTVGKKEYNDFKAENESRRASGESYFVRVKNDIGSKEKMIVIWKKVSSEKEEFLTDLRLASTQPNHGHFFFGDKEGYRLVVHPEMRGIAAADPTLCLWFKKELNTKSRFISDIRVSYTKDDHIDLARKNFEMLPLCLSNFSLGYANIWILWASSQIVRLTDSDHIEKELRDYTAMLDKNPDDQILSKMVDQCKFRLREAQLAEEDHAKDIPGDDLTYTREFLALKSSELDKMRSVFRKSIDFDRDDRISVEDYCMFVREPLSMSPFIRQIFALSAAPTTNNKIGKPYPMKNNAPVMNIGATLKATAVFCMLSSSDLMKFIFAWYDAKGYGVIDNQLFLDLMAMFHPRHRDDVVVRAMKEVDLPVGGKMPFDKFESDCKKFPHLLYPAFRVQEKMRQRFFGPRWWKQKLGRYTEAKELLEQEKQKEQELEDIERKQRYIVSEELKNESMELFEIRKRRRKKRR